VMNPGYLRLVQTDGDELDQPATVADDAKGAIAGGDQFDRSLDDLPKHDFKFKMTADGDHGLEQRVCPVPSVEDRLQPVPQLRQKLVEPQVRQQRTGILAIHELCLPVPARHALIVRGRTAGRNNRAGRLPRVCP